MPVVRLCLSCHPSHLGRDGRDRIGHCKLGQQAWVIVEKAFGRDLASARELKHLLRTVFAEDAIFRIDQFLCKEAIMNILYFRFTNYLRIR